MNDSGWISGAAEGAGLVIERPAPPHGPAPHADGEIPAVSGTEAGTGNARRSGLHVFDRFRRETRFGVAALLSFLVLVGVLVWNKKKGGRALPVAQIAPAKAGAHSNGRSPGSRTPAPPITPAPATALADTSPPTPMPPPAPTPEPARNSGGAGSVGPLAMRDGVTQASLDDLVKPEETPVPTPAAAEAPKPAPAEGADHSPAPTPTPASMPDPPPPTRPEGDSPPAPTPATSGPKEEPKSPAPMLPPVEPVAAPAPPPPAGDPVPVTAPEPDPVTAPAPAPALPAEPAKAAEPASAPNPGAGGSTPKPEAVVPGPDPVLPAAPPTAKEPSPAPDRTPTAGAGPGSGPSGLPDLDPAVDPAPKSHAGGAGGSGEPGTWVPLPNAGKVRGGGSLDLATPSAAAAAVQAATPDRAGGSAATKNARPGAGRDEVEPLPHTVRRGENFWTISRLYYGSGRFWKALWGANRASTPAPEALYVGQTIRIPAPEALDPTLIEAERASRGTTASASTSASAQPPKKNPRNKAANPAEVDLPAGDPFARRKPEPFASIGAGNDDDAPAEPQRPRKVRYKVRRHETLRGIARDTLGDSHRADEILELNANVIDDPDNLVPGQVLELPGDANPDDPRGH